MADKLIISGEKTKNAIVVSQQKADNKINISGENGSNSLTAINNNAKYYTDKAEGFANKAEQSAIKSANSATQAQESVNTILNNEKFIAVSQNLEPINTVGENIENVNYVGENIESINQLVEDLNNLGDTTNIEIVATNIESVNTTAENIEAVKTLSGSTGNVETIVNNLTSINYVADNIEDVATVEENKNIVLAQTIIATQQATIATEQANKAELYRGQASQHAEEAQREANIASASAGMASNHLEDATEQATIATNKASEASQSASNALKSSQNSALSEANAKESENNAKASETNAKISEQNAKSSEQKCQEIYDRLGVVIKLKGRVDSIEDLPTSNVVNGDAYLVGVEGLSSYPEYYWYENHWEYMGSTEVKLEWGGISGILSNQTDLQAVLDNKLENQSNFKNGLSIGEDNIAGGSATIIGFRNNVQSANSILIGSDNYTTGANSVCIGEWCEATGNNSICIGNSAVTAEQNSIQLGEGFNTTPNSFQVGEHQLLNIETGLIPDERLSNNIARTVDIPSTSNFATKTELSNKQDKGDYALKSDVVTYTAGENITIENNVISATGGTDIDTSNLATKTDIANKQDKFSTALPLELGGLKTSTDNISYDNNGRAYLNDKAFWASIPELLPSIVGEGRNEYASFDDSMNTAERAELTFRKLKGFNGVYPQLNLEGYNAIIRNFTVGDIVMGDRVDNKVQMCFGKLENDCTFTPKLICRLQGTSSDFYKFAKMMFLYEPSYTKLNTSSGAWDGDYYMEYRESGSFKTISYKRQNELGGIENLYGVKFIEKDGAYSLAWVTESGDIVELSDSATFDELDFNCVIFNAYTFELPKDEVPDYYSFNPERYFVAKNTIDNVIVRMLDGTGVDSLAIKYSDDFLLNENNEISLNADKIPTMPIGSIIPVNASSNYVPNGLLPCDGATYSRSQFEDFCRNYLDKSMSLLNTCTMEEYEAEVAATGQCGKFGVDGLNTVVTDLGNTKAKIDTNGVAFASLYPNGVILEFIYDGSNWTVDGKVVNLSDYYITQTGTAAVGDSFTVRFGTVDSFRVPLIKDTETVVTNNIDYANGQEVVSPTVDSPFIVPYDGVYICSLGKNNVTSYLYINGVQSSYTYIDVDQVVLYPTFTIPLNKGDVIYWSVALTNKQSMFYPYKEEEKEKLKSFVVVANGQTNQSLMDWSAWASSLQGRLDTDVNNITNIGKANITDLLSPDYSAGVEKVWGETYTAEVSGWVWYCIRYATAGSTNLIANTCLYIDEVPMGVSGGQKSSSISQNSGLFKVGKGSTYRTQNPSAGGTSGGITIVKFFPDKGVTNA